MWDGGDFWGIECSSCQESLCVVRFDDILYKQKWYFISMLLFACFLIWFWNTYSFSFCKQHHPHQLLLAHMAQPNFSTLSISYIDRCKIICIVYRNICLWHGFWKNKHMHFIFSFSNCLPAMTVNDLPNSQSAPILSDVPLYWCSWRSTSSARWVPALLGSTLWVTTGPVAHR